MDITIKTADPSCYEAIKAAATSEGWGSYSRPDIEQALQSSILLAAYLDGEFAGFLRAISDGYISIFVAELLVTPRHRKKGVATALLHHVHSMFPKARIDLVSEQDDFYKKLGFFAFGTGMRKYI